MTTTDTEKHGTLSMTNSRIVRGEIEWDIMRDGTRVATISSRADQPTAGAELRALIISACNSSAANEARISKLEGALIDLYARAAMRFDFNDPDMIAARSALAAAGKP